MWRGVVAELTATSFTFVICCLGMLAGELMSDVRGDEPHSMQSACSTENVRNRKVRSKLVGEGK